MNYCGNILKSIISYLCNKLQIQDTAHRKGIRTTSAITPGACTSARPDRENSFIQNQCIVKGKALYLCI